MNSKKIVILFIVCFTVVIAFIQLSYSADQKNEILTPMVSLLLGKSINCSDSVLNGDETDIDCGGSCSIKCGAGSRCIGSTDCISGVCMSDVCQAPTCTDGVLNGDESYIDCGGAVCPNCVACNGNTDCPVGESCVENICQPL